MNSEIQLIWQELQADIARPALLWQVSIIVTAIFIAWAINAALRNYLMQKAAPVQWRLAIDNVNRVLFPLSCLMIVLLGQLVLSTWQHISLLKLASRLFFAMSMIRIIGYLFSPSGWLKTLESVIAWVIWSSLTLHLTGVLSEIIQALEDMRFNIGKNPVNLLLVLQALLTVIVTIFIALWLSRLLENKLMRADQVNVNVRVVLTKLIRMVLLFIATLVALSAVGLDITLLSVFGGALGVGLGLGMQRIASNYVSGFIILLDKSMQIGDVISVDKHYGVVHDMRSRYMVLAKQDGTHVIIPNETLIITSVVNYSLTEHKGRAQLMFTIAFDSPLEQAIKTATEIACKEPRVLSMPAPGVHVNGFAEQGVELILTVWVADLEHGTDGLQSTLYLEIWKAFRELHIQFVQPAIQS